MSRNGEVLVAFASGAAAGAVAALLFAPEKGEVTRRRLQEGAEDLYKKSGRAIESAQKAVGSAAYDAVEAASQKTQELGDIMKHRVGAIRGAVADGKDAYHLELERAA